MNRIHVAAPDLGGREEQYALDAIRSTWIASTGKYVDRFELEFAALCGSRAAISTCNGTAALHLAMLAYGLGPGDEVIVPSLTYLATANAVKYTGATPVFVDVSDDTWCIDPAAIEEAISERTKGIVAVHLYGHPADMDAIAAIAAKHGLWVVEDAAEAHGATYRGRPTGSLASIGVFSFYGNKLLTSGEGGAVTVSDRALEERIRLLRGQGMDPARRYWFPIVGYNYRLTNVASAILCAQLERLDEIVAQRMRVFAGYRERLEGIPGIGFQPVAQWAKTTPWLYSITVDAAQFGRTRDSLAAALDRAGIETRPFFHPIHRLPPYARPASPTLPVTDDLAAAGMNLPTSSSLTDADLDRIATAIRDASVSR
ncbi:MAG: DegT/DnrJ/EryC1/StrS family aminotransferase [Chloroflexota bacterium]